MIQAKSTINRVFARASHETFTIPPIKALLEHYVINNGQSWIDPFAGNSQLAQYRNDHHPMMPTAYHMEAEAFARLMTRPDLNNTPFAGVLFDPPYSYRQVSEHYRFMGIKATQLDTSYNFYARVMDILSPYVVPGGYTISFGWNSNGFGKKRGFSLVEILLVAHGLHHNDTIVTVEQKI